MDEVAQYNEYADECRGLAATAKNPEHKKQLLEMATACIPSPDRSASLQNGIWANPWLRRAKPGELPIEAPTQFEFELALCHGSEISGSVKGTKHRRDY